MKPVYRVVDIEENAAVTAKIRSAEQRDFLKTEEDNWQTSWMSDFIQDASLEKYALEIVHIAICRKAYWFMWSISKAHQKATQP